MATLTEKIDSREWTEADKSSVTFHYILDGTADDLTARSLLLGSTPTWYNGLRRDECTLEPIFVDTVIGTTATITLPRTQPCMVEGAL